MKAKIYRNLERFNDDNSGIFESIVFFGFLVLIAIAIVK
jgi:hypothetical protein